MTDPRLPASGAWAIEAMIASYNYVYQVTYNSTYEDLGTIGVSNYGAAPIASFEMEVLAFDKDPLNIQKAILSYPKLRGKRYVINVFHATPSDTGLKYRYNALGYDFVHTSPILGRALPVVTHGRLLHVHKVENIDHINFANRFLAEHGEHIPPQTLGEPHIYNYYAQLEHRAVGWAQLVTVYDGVGYINQMYTSPVFRKRGIATALLKRIHREAHALGLRRMALIPSDMSMSLYRRAGYHALAYLSVFRPKESK